MPTETDMKPLPEFFIGRNLANDRIKRFMKPGGKHELLSNHMDGNGFLQGETKYIWYPKSYFETLVEEMTLAGADGLRIYFGEYENEPLKPAGQTCLIIVLTKPSGDGHKDFLLEETDSYQARLNLTRAQKREFNIGALCPPVCGKEEAFFPEN